jgi:hypothetical protein
LLNIFLSQSAEFFSRFFRLGGTIAMVKRLLSDDELMERWIEFLTVEPEFKLIHGRFTPLRDKLELVKSWPGINSEDVDVAFKAAMNNGTIVGYEREVGENPFLDIVVTVYRESIPATLMYACERMQEAWGERYYEWTEAYAQGVDDDRVKAIPGAKPFTPNRIVVEVVDFGANWNRHNGLILEDVQKARTHKLADFAVIYNAVQSPKWLEQMDGEEVPYALMAALLLNVPGRDSWRISPELWCRDDKVRLTGDHVETQFTDYAAPLLCEYKR